MRCSPTTGRAARVRDGQGTDPDLKKEDRRRIGRERKVLMVSGPAMSLASKACCLRRASPATSRCGAATFTPHIGFFPG